MPLNLGAGMRGPDGSDHHHFRWTSRSCPRKAENPAALSQDLDQTAGARHLELSGRIS